MKNSLLIEKTKIAVIGLGYVGLPVAVEFAKKYNVVGFDLNTEKLELYKKGIDVTNEVGNEVLKNSEITFTNNEELLKTCNFFVVAVPTPINSDKTPDLTPIINASELVGRNLTKGTTVVYESTVYPGTTEEICVPILQRESGLVYKEDFKVGYSPERINPGDKIHTLTNITKVVSGCDSMALENIAAIYDSIIEAGVYKAETIKVAEASKVIENSQRDINIAFMNELSMVFNKMDINTKAVLEAAGTKWNFLRFHPGLVGGHCIGVDPYYFTYKAEQLGYHSQIILSGRKINDDMGKYVAENTIKSLIKSEQHIKGAKVLVLGLTFKENVPDVRNTKVIDIISELEDYGVEVIVHDPVADKQEVLREYGIELKEKEELSGINGVVYAVNHKEFEPYCSIAFFDGLFLDNEKKVLIDVKNVLEQKDSENSGYVYWTL